MKTQSTGKRTTSLSAEANPPASPDGQRGALGCCSHRGAHATSKRWPEALVLAFADELLASGTAGGFLWVCSVTNSCGGWVSGAAEESEAALNATCRVTWRGHADRSQRDPCQQVTDFWPATAGERCPQLFGYLTAASQHPQLEGRIRRLAEMRRSSVL